MQHEICSYILYKNYNNFGNNARSQKFGKNLNSGVGRAKNAISWKVKIQLRQNLAVMWDKGHMYIITNKIYHMLLHFYQILKLLWK